jgi:hypothetical protein
MKKNYKEILIIALGIIIILMQLKSCNLQEEKDNLLGQVSQYQLNEKAFKTKILKDSSTLASQEQTILTQEEAIKLGLLKLEGEIKEVQSQVTQKQVIKYEKVNVPFVPNNFTDTSGWYAKLTNGDQSVAFVDSLMANSIIVPQRFEKKERWIEIDGVVKKEGLVIDSLKISNESSVTIGYKKWGFLGLKKRPIVEIKNTNPYLGVTKINNIVIKKNKSIFKKPIFWAGVGLLGGLILK